MLESCPLALLLPLRALSHGPNCAQLGQAHELLIVAEAQPPADGVRALQRVAEGVWYQELEVVRDLRPRRASLHKQVAGMNGC